MSEFTLGGRRVANDAPLTVLGGVNVLEDLDTALRVGEVFRRECERQSLGYVFKASFDKANRSSADSYRGPGLDDGLELLAKIKRELGVPVVTDVHEPWQCAPAAEVADLLQIPAFLVRQTDLIVAAAAAGRPLHLKKMQLMAASEMANVVAKCRKAGGRDVLLCERGTLFGPGRLAVDVLELAELIALGHPVSLDVTHALQLPGGLGHASGGRRELCEPLAVAGTALGIAALFVESHVSVDTAPCDGPSAIPLDRVGRLLSRVRQVDDLVKSAAFDQM
ncbi:3-deoxy-8-phosphooctulonate synthase [Actinocorallia lasiicapitis]